MALPYRFVVVRIMDVILSHSLLRLGPTLLTTGRSGQVRSRINSAKGLPCDGQMLHSFDPSISLRAGFAQDRFVQHDNHSNKL